MSYTTVSNVAGMFPAFVRGIPQQRPSDVLIQQYIDDVAGEINAVLSRRFTEVIRGQYQGNLAAYQSALSRDGLNLLERMNRCGAGAQLGKTLATLGVGAAERLANDFRSEYNRLLSALSATNEQGEPLTGGLYDHLFDSQSATPSPRPGLVGIAGGDQPKGQTPSDSGSSNFFGKFDKR
ncbi:MAG TPA: hypothetical protein VFZ08_04890 [Terriglobia bacterium]|nr:hypothetical protein [Terriglobia bacterium]